MSQLDAIVVGISPDDVGTLRRFNESCGVPFRFGSDKDGSARRDFDVLRRFGLGTSRVTYLIDKQGTIRAVFHDEIRMGRHIADAVKALEALGDG